MIYKKCDRLVASNYILVVQTGCFHLQLKMSPSHRSFPEDLVVQLKEDHMTFWSVHDQQECMEWQLRDIKSIHLHKALYVNIKGLRYIPLDVQLTYLMDVVVSLKATLLSMKTFLCLKDSSLKNCLTILKNTC